MIVDKNSCYVKKRDIPFSYCCNLFFNDPFGTPDVAVNRPGTKSVNSFSEIAFSFASFKIQSFFYKYAVMIYY